MGRDCVLSSTRRHSVRDEAVGHSKVPLLEHWAALRRDRPGIHSRVISTPGQHANDRALGFWAWTVTETKAEADESTIRVT